METRTEEQQRLERLSKTSRKWFVVSLISLAAFLPAIYIVDRIFDPGFGMLPLAFLIFGACAAVAACFGVVAFRAGLACARYRKHVLFWTIPLWLLYTAGALLGLALPLSSMGVSTDTPHGLQLICIVVWLGITSLVSLIHWLISDVYGKRLRYLSWKTVPLWSLVILGALLALLSAV